MLAKAMRASGLLRLLEALPTRPGILVVNHHRIGDASRTRFDRGVFSATQDGLSQQLTMLQKRMPIIGEDELEQFVLGKAKLKRMHAVITFDDGYLDNYELALPVLKAHRCSALFFLVTSYVGSAAIPWWDEIAYLVRNSTKQTLSLKLPYPLRVNLAPDREIAIWEVLRHYKHRENLDGAAFIAHLRSEAACSVPQTGRRFLSWEEAGRMQEAGMTIGSHTISHPVLSQCSATDQQIELTQSKLQIERRLGGRVHSIAYPVGTTSAFTAETETLAARAGYRLAFGFSGGLNMAGDIHNLHLRRLSLASDSIEARTAIAITPLFPAF